MAFISYQIMACMEDFWNRILSNNFPAIIISIGQRPEEHVNSLM